MRSQLFAWGCWTWLNELYERRPSPSWRGAYPFIHAPNVNYAVSTWGVNLHLRGLLIHPPDVGVDPWGSVTRASSWLGHMCLGVALCSILGADAHDRMSSIHHPRSGIFAK